MTLPPKISISGHSGTGSGSLAAVRTNYIGRLSWTYSSLVVAVLSYVGLKLAHNPVKMATLSATSLICLTKNDFGIIQGSLSVGYINGTLLQKAKSRAKNPDPTISTESTMIPTTSQKQTVNLYVRGSSWSAEIFLLTTTQTTVLCGQIRG